MVYSKLNFATFWGKAKSIFLLQNIRIISLGKGGNIIW